MAHYIGPDGRVIDFEAEVKADGTIRPKNYREFINDTVSSEQMPQTPQASVSSPVGERSLYNSSIYERKPLSKSQRKTVRSEVEGIISRSGFNSWVQNLLKKWYEPLLVVDFYTSRRKTMNAYTKDLTQIQSLINRINNLLRNRVYRNIGTKPVSTPEKTVTHSAVTLSNCLPVGSLSYKDYKKVFPKIQSFLVSQVSQDKIPSKVLEFICARYNESYTTITSANFVNHHIKGTRFENFRTVIFQLINQCNQIIVNYWYDNQSKTNSNKKAASVQTPSAKGDMHPTTIKPVREADISVVQRQTTIAENANILRHSNPPRFGYARDYFGRVQERDSYRENRPVNPYHSRSDYDREDDNESLDSLD